jgi:ribosome-associated protein
VVLVQQANHKLRNLRIFVNSLMDSNRSTTINLDQFLKLIGITDTGGQAKQLIQNGSVRVNGEVELRRGRKLTAADQVEVQGESFPVEIDPTEP